MNIQEKATLMRSKFTSHEDPPAGWMDGVVYSNCGRDVKSLCLAAHDDGKITGEEWIYEFTVNALDMIIASGDKFNVDDWDETHGVDFQERWQTADYFKWLSGFCDGSMWADQVIEDIQQKALKKHGITILARLGMGKHSHHIAENVIEWLLDFKPKEKS